MLPFEYNMKLIMLNLVGSVHTSHIIVHPCLQFLALYVDISFHVFILHFQVLDFDFIWRWWFDARP